MLPASQLLPSPQPTTAFASAGYRLPWGLREVLVLYWGPIVATLLATMYPAVASVAQAALSDPSAPLRTAAPRWQRLLQPQSEWWAPPALTQHQQCRHPACMHVPARHASCTSQTLCSTPASTHLALPLLQLGSPLSLLSLLLGSVLFVLLLPFLERMNTKINTVRVCMLAHPAALTCVIGVPSGHQAPGPTAPSLAVNSATPAPALHCLLPSAGAWQGQAAVGAHGSYRQRSPRFCG